MSLSLDIADIVAQILSLPGSLPSGVPVMVRKKGEPANDIVARINQQKLCVFVMPALPTSAKPGIETLFFDKAEIRVRILEQVKLNRLPVNAYDLVDHVATAIHWQPNSGIDRGIAALEANDMSHEEALAAFQLDPANASLLALTRMLSHPLYIAARPVEQVEDENTRIIDVIFIAAFQLT